MTTDERVWRVAAVDDDERMLRLLVAALTSEHRRVLTFEAGDIALEYLQNADACDLLILDVQMPGLDGFEVAREVRRRPHLARLPILALTGLSGPDDAARILEAGADAYLHKPVNIEELGQVVAGLLHRDPPRATAAPSADAGGATAASAGAVESVERAQATLAALARHLARGGVARVDERPPRSDPPATAGSGPVRFVTFTVDAETYDSSWPAGAQPSDPP